MTINRAQVENSARRSESVNGLRYQLVPSFKNRGDSTKDDREQQKESKKASKQKRKERSGGEKKKKKTQRRPLRSAGS